MTSPATSESTATTESTTGLRIAVIGAGKMGGILVQAFLRAGLFPREHVTATVAHEARATSLSKNFGITVTTDNLAAAEQADVILLGVKPQQMHEVIRGIAPALRPGKLLISFAASVKTGAIENAADCEISVIRAMPNTPAMLGAGVTAICRGKFVTDQQLTLAEQIFSTVGRTVIVDQKHMDAVTGLSGSGPAFLYIIIEALAEAGVNVGLPRDIATLLAAQTTYGAARMVLETGSHPALLKDEVTTHAGCAVGSLRVTLIKAVKRATERARELASS
jgi:pyrroline-5-carboxylate reductase